jgi:bifunctional non-homologous end joining protein LigD
MLATLVREPFHKPGWVYEEKYDGYRILAYKEGAPVRLYSRNAIDRTDRFAEIAAAISALKPATLLLDGEVSVFDREGVSRFQLLQNLGTGKSVFAVSDCLYRDGQDLRSRPLSERRVALEQSVARDKMIVPSRRLASNGLEAYRVATAKKFEGLSPRIYLRAMSKAAPRNNHTGTHPPCKGKSAYPDRFISIYFSS